MIMKTENQTMTLRDWHGREVQVTPMTTATGRNVFVTNYGGEMAICKLCGSMYSGWSGRESMCKHCLLEHYS